MSAPRGSPLFRRLLPCAAVLVLLFLYLGRPLDNGARVYNGIQQWRTKHQPPNQQHQQQHSTRPRPSGWKHRRPSNPPLVSVPWHWKEYLAFHAFYNGIKTLVDLAHWIPEQQAISSDQDFNLDEAADDAHHLDFSLSRATYPYDHLGDLSPCYLDTHDKIPAPDVWSVPGIPQFQPAPSFGDYAELGMRADRCWERFGRLGAYGYSYPKSDGGFGLASPPAEEQKLWDQLVRKIDYNGIEWGKVQERCFDKNLGQDGVQYAAAPSAETGLDSAGLGSTTDLRSIRKNQEATGTTTGNNTSRRVRPRMAVVLRAWTGLEWTPMRIMNLRALIVELSLKTGGALDVHILMHVKDDSLDISDAAVEERLLHENVPNEFRDMTTLWSVPYMTRYYRGFTPDMDLANPSNKPIYHVYRSPHFVLQWFAQWHPEYEHFWNWELDIRATGHYYELFHGMGQWADKQPRKYLWERNARFWIPELHGSYAEFRDIVGNETVAAREKVKSPWGPAGLTLGGRNVDLSALANKAIPPQTRPPRRMEDDNYEWGVGEAADLITLTPLFDPAKHAWILRHDVTGYGLDQNVLPPRRASIITVGRYSRRLLQAMHDEVRLRHRSMFPEMFPGSVALQYGLKAVFVPHPIFFERNWPLEALDEVFNDATPVRKELSVYYRPPGNEHGTAEENFFPASYYFNAKFGPRLWRKWLGGGPEEEEDGSGEMEAMEELSEEKVGRMCLRGMLIHPVKYDFDTDDAIAGT